MVHRTTEVKGSQAVPFFCLAVYHVFSFLIPLPMIELRIELISPVLLSRQPSSFSKRKRPHLTKVGVVPTMVVSAD